ncbi:MAG: hypothetical protein F4018_04490 [Acidobacteria bacterium]|nr:hypothetical protein [Acidobacteriota bacterium]
MTRPDVRGAVEAAIRRHLDERRSPPRPAESRRDPVVPADAPAHGRFLRAALPDDPPDGRCVIEPSVECTGCGYCQSHGH